MGNFLNRAVHGFVNDATNLPSGMYKGVKGLVAPSLRADYKLLTGGVNAGARSAKQGSRQQDKMVRGTAQSYMDLLRHPIRQTLDHPLNTALMVAPAVGKLAGLRAADYVPPASKAELFDRAVQRARGPAHTTAGEAHFSSPPSSVSMENRFKEFQAREQASPVRVAPKGPSAAAIRSSLDTPTQFGSAPLKPGSLAAREKLTEMLSQGKIGGDGNSPGYNSLRATQPRTEGPASFKEAAGPGRQVFDFSHEGRMAADNAAYRTENQLPMKSSEQDLIMHYLTRGGKGTYDEALTKLDGMVRGGHIPPDQGEDIFRILGDHFGAGSGFDVASQMPHGAVPRFNAHNTAPFKMPRGPDLTDKRPPIGKQELLKMMMQQYHGGRNRQRFGHFNQN